MKKKDLTDLGIEDAEVIKAIQKLHGQGIENLKADVKTLTGEKDTLTDELTEAGKTIESFKSMDVEAIKKAADDWEAKAKEAETKREEAETKRTDEVGKLKFDHALEKELKEAGAKSTKSVKAHLKTEELKLDDEGKIPGLDTQLEGIVKEHDYLFDPKEDEDEDEEPDDLKIVKGSKKKSILSDSTVQAARTAAGLPADEVK